ncbi:MAG: hypothetical protein PHN78_00710 [Dehalococcoidales bacterium]|nr:hypothetical protein [Dehalococcoidales bacterium]
MVEYVYSVREIPREPKALDDELIDLGEDGWELITILERSQASAPGTKTGWVLVSKKVLADAA